MKNTIKYILMAVVLTAMVTSCNLDRYPYDSIEQSQAFKTVKDATTFDNGLYAFLRGRVYGIYTFSTDVQADLLNATLDYGNRNGFPHKWDGFLADDYTIRDTWTGYYNGLSNVNNFLQNVGQIPTTVQADADLIKKYKGEAYFLRAYYYHQLILRWAKDYEPSTAATDPGVPLVLAFDITARPARATVAEVYAQILADIALAKTNLAAVPGAQASSKITIDCVTALEARVDLCMHNWSGAITAANSLISSGTYPLISNAATFKNMWVNDAGTELIFQVFASQPSELGNANNIYLGYSSGLAKWIPDFVPEQWVIDQYTDTDIRKATYLEQKTLYIAGGTYPNVYCINKFPGNPTLFTTAVTNYQHKPKIFRIAEMYLISAEAAAQSTSTEAAGLATLNVLRVARGIPALSGLSGTAVMDAVKAERTRELLCEGNRLDDLERWKMGVTRRPAQNTAFLNTGTVFDQLTKPAGDNKFVWGLPANDITINTNLVQNPGW